MSKRVMAIFAFLIIVTMMTTTSLYAATYNAAAGGGEYNADNSTWGAPNLHPTAADTANIALGGVTISTSDAASTTVNITDQSLTISGGHSLTMADGIHIAGTGTGLVWFANGDNTVTGNITSAVTSTSGTPQRIEVDSGATATINGDISLQNYILLTGGGTASTLKLGAGHSMVADVMCGGSNGVLNFLGAATVTGTMGTSNALSEMDVNAGTVAVTGAVNATALKYVADSTVTISAAGTFGTVSNTSAGNYAGTLSLGAASSAAGNVGGTDGTRSLKEVDINNTGSNGFGGNLYTQTLKFVQDGTATVTGIGGFTAVSNSSGGVAGTLSLGAASGASGNVGGAGGIQSLKEVDINNTGSNGFGGNLYTQTLKFQQDGTATVTGTGGFTTVSHSGGVVIGTLSLGAASAVSGNVGGAGGTQSLKEVDINNIGTNSFGNNLFTQTLKFVQDGTATVTGTGGFTTVSNTSGGIAGTLSLGAASAVSGDVGGTGASLTKVNINNVGTSSFGGDVNAATFNFAADGTATVAAGHNLNGAVTTDTAGGGTGTLQYNGATTIGGNIGTTGAGGKALKEVDFGGDTGLGYDIAATTTKINAGTTTTSGNRTITGALSNGATLDIGTTNLVVTGIFSQAGAATLDITANSPTSIGKITSTGSDAALVNGTKIAVTVNYYLPNNATIPLVEGGANSVYNTPVLTSTNQYTKLSPSNVGGTLFGTVNRTSNGFASVAGNSNASNVGGVLDNVTNPSTDMFSVLTTLGNSTSSQVASSENSMSPTNDGAVTQSAAAMLNNFTNNTETHLDNVRATGGATGVATGDDYLNGIDIWAQGLGDYAHQDSRGSSNGYNATSWGVSGGADKSLFNDSIRVGLGSGYGQTFVRSKDFSGKTDIDSIPATIYCDYTNGKYPFYIDAVFAFIYNMYNGSREVTAGPTITRTANADYDGEQYSGYIEGGYSFFYKKLSLTPLASFQYMHLHTGSYTETDAGSLNLNVASQDYDTAQTGLGAKSAYPFDLKYGTLTPDLHFKWLYDWVGDNQATTAGFAGGGTSFGTNGFSPAQSAYDFGTRIDFKTKYNVTIGLDYDFLFKSDYYEHYGTVDVKYSF